MLSKTIFATALLALATSVAAAPTPVALAASSDVFSDLGNLLSPGSSDSALNGNSAEGNGNGNGDGNAAGNGNEAGNGDSAGNGNSAGNNDGNGNSADGNSLINLSKFSSISLPLQNVLDINTKTEN